MENNEKKVITKADFLTIYQLSKKMNVSEKIVRDVVHKNFRARTTVTVKSGPCTRREPAIYKTTHQCIDHKGALRIRPEALSMIMAQVEQVQNQMMMINKNNNKEK